MEWGSGGCMRKAFPFLLLAAISWGGYTYYHNHPSISKAQANELSQDQSQEAEAKPQLQDPDHVVTVVSPLEQLMDKATGAITTKEAPKRPWKPTASDYIKASPVGTSTAIVHRTFAVTSPAKFLFAVPPHAATPQLRGTYRSFIKDSGGESSDENADVDLLLMNDQQYADFLQGHPSDTIYSIDSSHAQDVSFGLPATLDHPAQYYLVFRNSSPSPGKKLVQADFRVDF
jgi:hypothetical protein